MSTKRVGHTGSNVKLILSTAKSCYQSLRESEEIVDIGAIFQFLSIDRQEQAYALDALMFAPDKITDTYRQKVLRDSDVRMKTRMEDRLIRLRKSKLQSST